MILKIPFSNPLFPGEVKNLTNPPKELSVICSDEVGKDFAWPIKSLAVIGSRTMSDYGKKVVLELIPQLVEAGFVIISGLAEGVDDEAQRITLKSGGTTVGVLGFGVMQLNHFSNRELGKEVVRSKTGYLVSPFDPYISASKWTFLERNRLIAALSDAVLVIEAVQKSGCMSTVEAALELGKDVYVVPGSIFSYTSMGTNELIKQGAHLVNRVDDIKLRYD